MASIEGWAINCEESYGWLSHIAYYGDSKAEETYIGTAHYGLAIPEGKRFRDAAKKTPEVEAVCAFFETQPPNKAFHSDGSRAARFVRR